MEFSKIAECCGSVASFGYMAQDGHWPKGSSTWLEFGFDPWDLSRIVLARISIVLDNIHYSDHIYFYF